MSGISNLVTNIVSGVGNLINPPSPPRLRPGQPGQVASTVTPGDRARRRTQRRRAAGGQGRQGSILTGTGSTAQALGTSNQNAPKTLLGF